MCAYVEKKYEDEIFVNIKKSKSHRAWPTTGMLAIDLAIAENNLDSLYLFGFDLYLSDYMVKKNRSYQNAEWDKSKMMRYYLEDIVKEFTNITFYNSSFVKFDHKNWINI
jgi:hypothetical protein